jgi:hypothetical protein
MSKVLTTAAAAVIIGFASMGAAQARGDFDRNPRPFAQVQTQDTHRG